MAPSAQSERAKVAVKAMKLIGFDPVKAKKVLKKLIKVYENNWEYIEAENYRLLADSILDDQESANPESNATDATAGVVQVFSRRRFKRRQDDSGQFSSAVDAAACDETSFHTPTSDKLPQYSHNRQVFSPISGENQLCSTSGTLVCYKKAKIEPDAEVLQDIVAVGFNSSQDMSEDDEPNALLPPHGIPSGTAVSLHCLAKQGKAPEGDFLGENASTGLTVAESQEAPINENEIRNLKFSAQETRSDLSGLPDRFSVNTDLASSNMGEAKLLLTYSSDRPDFKMPSLELVLKMVEDRCLKSYKILQPDFSLMNLMKEICQCTVDLAAESSNEKQEKVRKVIPLLEPLKRSEYPGPSQLVIRGSSGGALDLAALEISRESMNGHNSSIGMQQNCVPESSSHNTSQSLAIIPQEEHTVSAPHSPHDENDIAKGEERVKISVFNDLAAESSNEKQEKVRKVIPLLEPLKRSEYPGPSQWVIRGSSGGALDLAALEISRESMNGHNSSIGMQQNCVPESSSHNTSQSLAIIPQQEHTVSAPHPPHDENDIAKGEERVKISVINEFTSEKYPPFFNYIPRNAVYHNAHVNFSLTRISDEDCCFNCFGDCLSAPIPCACTRETGGEFAYTLDGLLKKEFLNECISMNRDPDKHHQFYCKDCPIEKSKNEHMPDACKGHLVRRFIKECWSKCGCNKQCGNRIVQRGISRNLQVFFVADGKGWGLRTLEELPRGAFVCEYVGEILTNIELDDRTIQKTGGAKHTYPVLLDADWGSEAGLRDDEALCLDATFYGNVGRFVNHRCIDATMVEVPVEWETPDHHYYHLAYFTTRKVEALEELTWDYGIDFDDHSHPIKAFKCLCGSKFCRDRARSKARSRASGSK